MTRLLAAMIRGLRVAAWLVVLCPSTTASAQTSSQPPTSNTGSAAPRTTGPAMTAKNAQEGLRVQGPDLGIANIGVVSFVDAGGLRIGYIGDGSALDDNTLLASDHGSVQLVTEAGRVMTVDKYGQVGIGVTSPTANLDVNDAAGGAHIQLGLPNGGGPAENVIRFGDRNCAGGQCVAIGESETEDRLAFYGGRYRFNKVTDAGDGGSGNVEPGSDGLQNLGSVTNRWGVVFAANGVINTSDARLKQNIATLGYGLRDLLQLRAVSFEWKDHLDGRTHLGLLAQETQPVIPEAVVQTSDAGTPLGISYSELIPVVIKAIQEQEAIAERDAAVIKSLQAENATLRRQGAELDGRLSALEDALNQLNRKREQQRR
jgi:endosialidase-like protein